MITGRVDTDWPAIVPLVAQHREPAKPDATIDFLIDTGLTGYLSLPPEWVQRLGLTVVDIQRGMTADGRVGYFETEDVCILWHGQPPLIRAQVLDEPPIGTRLLRSHQAHLRWIAGATFELHRITA